MPKRFWLFVTLPRSSSTAFGASHGGALTVTGELKATRQFLRRSRALARSIVLSITLLALVASAVMAGPTASAQVLAEGRNALKAGDYNKVHELLKHFDDPDSLLIVGQAFWIGNYGCWTDNFKIAAQLLPNNVEAVALNAIGCLRQRKRDDALFNARRAVRLDPKSGLAHAALASVLQAKGDAPAATTEINNALRLVPNNETVMDIAQMLYFSQLDTGKTEAMCNKMVKFNPKGPLAHMRLGELYTATGDIPRSIAEFEKAIVANKGCHNAYFEQARNLFDKNEFAHAVADYSEILKTDTEPDMVSKSYRGRALAYARLGKYKEALDDINKVDKGIESQRLISGGQERDMVLKADVLQKLKRLQESVDTLDMLLQRSRSNEGLCMRARVLAQKGDWEKALRDYNTMIELDNTVPAWFNERGRVLQKLGKNVAANNDFGTAKKLQAGLAQ
jgi:tetratricopeptide (TPR) repeat protein